LPLIKLAASMASLQSSLQYPVRSILITGRPCHD
jgi:hypothetical protein